MHNCAPVLILWVIWWKIPMDRLLESYFFPYLIRLILSLSNGVIWISRAAGQLCSVSALEGWSSSPSHLVSCSLTLNPVVKTKTCSYWTSNRKPIPLHPSDPVKALSCSPDRPELPPQERGIELNGNPKNIWQNGCSEEEEKGALDGQEWVGEVIHALNYLQQLRRKGCPTPRCYNWCGAQSRQVHGQPHIESVGLRRVSNAYSTPIPRSHYTNTKIPISDKMPSWKPI